MGACYSNKGGGGKFTYTTVDMTSTKLNDGSYTPRATPYSRGTASNPPFSSRKGIPVPAKREHLARLANNNQNNELLNVKNPSPLPLQSSIPRFTSGVNSPAAKTEVNDNIIYAVKDRNENRELHSLNNNILSSSHPTVTDALSRPVSARSLGAMDIERNRSKLQTNSRDYLENKNRQAKMESGANSTKMNTKFTSPGMSQRSFLPQCRNKSPHVTSRVSLEVSRNSSYGLGNKCTNGYESKEVKSSSSSPNAHVESEISKSFTNSDSRDSIADFDSGIGSSITEKSKQDDGDTLKDIDRLETFEELLPSSIKGIVETSGGAKPKTFNSDMSFKCPTYKRELNGKWTIEDKAILDLHRSFSAENNIKQKNTQCQSSLSTSVSFPTYASYKGFMSFKTSSAGRIDEECGVETKNKSPVVRQNRVPLSKGSSVSSVSGPISNAVSPSSEHPQTYTPSRDSKSVNSISPSSSSGLEVDDKSDGISSETKSPTSEIENRVFLIDDEISDQPNLISVANEKTMDSPQLSLQQSVTELHELQMSSSVKGKLQNMKTRDRLHSDHRDSLVLSSELGSSCSSIASDDLMLDYEKKIDFPDGTINEGLASPVRKISDLEIIEDQLSELGFDKSQSSMIDDKPWKRLHRRSSGPPNSAGSSGKNEWRLRSVSLPLRPPRPMSVSEADDGSVIIDSSSYRLLSQDLNGVKTLLLRLKSVIQEAETINPFDQGNTKNIFYQSLVHNDSPSSVFSQRKDGSELSPASIALENADLHRQIVLLQKQLEERDRTIHLLQQQMTKYANFPKAVPENTTTTNAATQTERPKLLSSTLVTSVDDSSETLVSVQDAFEEHITKSMEEQGNFRSQMEDMSRSLNSLYQDLHASSSDPPVSSSDAGKSCSSQ